MGRDSRKATRRNLIYYFPVYTQGSHRLLGRIVDLTDKGFMLVHEEPLPQGHYFDVYVKFPAEAREWEKIHVPLRVLSRWSKRDINDSLLATGFEFIDKSEEAEYHINRVIMTYNFEKQVT
ncbi:type IV pilus assembly PilZ [Desulfurispirillum indicum S5]|uniref:Type IV pilus assembly PilZ n=1 Tax=Desulfurispirillum indicum (strain ATCC BAA-1389 / DSM 22839 / S5) TaxID=653733 RepID=E6W4M9_DESIS|nr:PilZ domain-containing protein [Desulfurispirillum indicum]ADU67102.1 type IV pilus assembly PilZ [Desulfurispirillum indicum S5]